MFCGTTELASDLAVGVSPPKLEAAWAHVEVLLLPGFTDNWLAEEEELGVADHLGDGTIWVLKED